MDGSGRSHRPKDSTIISLLMVMVVAWAVNFIISKIALREMPATYIVGIRNIAASLVILPFYLWERRAAGPATWTWSEAPVLWLLGVLGVGMNQLFFVLGIARTTVAHAAVMIGLAPVSTLMVAVLFKEEKLNAKRLLGMALALSGVAVLQLAHRGDPSAAAKGPAPSAVGDLLIYLSGLSYAMFTVLGRRYTRVHSGITMNTFAYAGSAIALLPLTWAASRGIDPSTFSWKAWASVAYMAVFSSVLGYLILYWALRWMPASRVSMFSYAQPVLATLLGMVFLHEEPGVPMYAGGALVLAGVLVSERF